MEILHDVIHFCRLVSQEYTIRNTYSEYTI